MSVVLAICVAVVFTVSTFMILGRELKGIAVGVFLVGHAANLCIISMSGSPITSPNDPTATKAPPLLHEVQNVHESGEHTAHAEAVDAAEYAPSAQQQDPLEHMVDPLPQALILTAIVIGFGVMGFLLSLIVVTSRATNTLNVDDLSQEQLPTASKHH